MAAPDPRRREPGRRGSAPWRAIASTRRPSSSARSGTRAREAARARAGRRGSPRSAPRGQRAVRDAGERAVALIATPCATRAQLVERRRAPSAGCGARAITTTSSPRSRARPIAAKPLANPPLHAVAHDGVSDLAARRDPEPRAPCSAGRRARAGRTHPTSGAVPPSAIARNSRDRRIRASRGNGPVGRDHPRFDGVDGVSRFRPLARRRLSTSRPPWVFIRERKPWTRRRRIRLG